MNTLQNISSAATSSVWAFLATVCGLFIALRLVLGMAMQPPAKPAGRIVGVVGLMGQGKTLYCVREAAARARRGQRIASNFHLDLGKRYEGRWTHFKSWEQFATLRNCTVFVDEAHLYAPSLPGFALPVVARWGLSMARKNGVDVFWIVQHESRVAKGLRDLTGEMIQCKRVAMLHRARSYAPEDFRRVGTKHLWQTWYRPSRRLRRLYNTFELILPESSIDPEGVVSSIADARVAALNDTSPRT